MQNPLQDSRFTGSELLEYEKRPRHGCVNIRVIPEPNHLRSGYAG